MKRATARLGNGSEDLALAPIRELRRSELDRLLGLPDGAARQRRLFVLRVARARIEGTSIRFDDRLVVEPGTKMRPGSLVACRRRRSLDILAVRLGDSGRPFVGHPSPEWLPLAAAEPCAVIGTVLVAVRAISGRWAIVRGRSPDASTRRPSRSLYRGMSPFEASHAQRLQSLEHALATIEAGAQSTRLSYPREARLLAAAATRLRALRKCLVAVREPRIYAALAEEIDLTVNRLRRTQGMTLNASSTACRRGTSSGPRQLRLSHVWS